MNESRRVQAETLLAQLVAVDSINPDLVPGAAGEGAIAELVAAWLAARGVDVSLHEMAPGRPSVVGVARGRGSGKALLLNGHLDTVGVEGMTAPHTPRVEAGRLYGRGAYDMKGGVAAAMLATAAAVELGLAGDVIFTGVADEENAGLGTTQVLAEALDSGRRVAGAIVAEPTELALAVAHKGFVWLEAETRGVAAHGSRPHLGVDAIVKMGKLLVALGELDERLQAGTRHRHLGPASLHASLITGGAERSSYPERCWLALERRTIPGETAAQVLTEIAGLIAALAASDPAFRCELRLGLERLPMETAEDHSFVALVAAAAQEASRSEVSVGGVSYWSDAATIAAAGVPTVLYGPLGAGAHAVEEWVDLDSVAQCAEVYLATACRLCG